MRAELTRSLRRIKPERYSVPLRRRGDADLDFVEAAGAFGPPLLLDTCVYIDGLEGVCRRGWRPSCGHGL